VMFEIIISYELTAISYSGTAFAKQRDFRNITDIE